MTSLAWVGTWRPHRPRGLIMAQFTSPGPKYSIPGTTGYLVHNPTKTKAPAYTFQRAKPPGADSCSPGPRYYPGFPAFLCFSLGDYSTDKANQHLYKCAPAPSMAFRHKAVKTDETPGKGTRGNTHACSPPVLQGKPAGQLF
uniref:ODF3A protein n=1 Tax=Buteo japonicus TaxID=224669 RepID=A0A8C0C2K4_9AVES